MVGQGRRLPFVGRGAELAVLHQRLVLAGRGEGGVVLVAGEPGIGKSRLLREFAGQAHDGGWRVLWGRAYETAGMPPYLPLVEALRAYLAECPLDELGAVLGRGAPDVARLVPELHDYLPELPPPPPLSPEGERYRLFESIAHALVGIAGAPSRAGLLLLLDDVHWADAPTLLLLQHLARLLPGAPLLLVIAHRSAASDIARPFADLLAEFSREGLADRLLLTPLSRDEAATLIAGISGRVPAPPMLAAIHRATEGNPFFLGEVVRQLQAEGRDLADPRAGVSWDLPEGVRQVISTRLARLRPVTHRLLQVASVLGERFDVDVLDAASDLGTDDVIDALEDGIAAGMIRDDGGTRAVAFAHALIRGVLYAELSPLRRQRVHLRVAEAIERVYAAELAPHVAELAYHFAQVAPGGDVDKAIDYAVRAAERAAAVLAFEEAARHYGLALQGLDQKAPDEHRHALRAELHARRGTAFARVAAWVDARPDLEAALAALAPERSERRAEVLIELSVACNSLLDNASVHRHTAEALTLAEQVGRADLAAEALAWRSQAHNADGDLVMAMNLFHRAVARAGDSWPAALVMPQMIFYWLGRYDEAIAYARRSRQSAEAASDPYLIMIAIGNLGTALAGGGGYDEAAEVFDEARQFARRHGVWPELARVSAMAAGLHLEVFDFAGAEAFSEEARDLARSSNFLPTIGQSGIDLLFNFARRGELGRVETLMPEVEAVLAQEAGWHEWLWKLRFAEARAEIALARRAWDEAVHWAEEAITRSRAIGRVKYEAAGLGSRARALQALGRTKEAIGDLRRAVALARPVGDPAMLLRAATPLLAIAGDSALAAEARQAVDRSLDALPDADLRRRFEAAEPVRLVLRLTAASAAGMRGAAHNDPGADSRPRYPDGLSAREVEVLRLLAAGTSNHEISDALVLSVRTVERHIGNIYVKTGVHNRTQATLYAQGHQLL